MKEIGAGLVRIPGLVAHCGWVSTVLCWYGELIGGSTLAARFRGSPRGRGLHTGDRWVRMLTSLGPCHIKIGQLLGARRDLFSDAVTTPLARLTDGAKPAEPASDRAGGPAGLRGPAVVVWEFGWRSSSGSRNRKKNYPIAGGLDE